jgi:hypothetical protein
MRDDVIRAEIDRELGLIDSAIALVRHGAAARVTVVNLRLGAAVLESARARAGLRGVRVTPEWGLGDTARSLVVDRVDGHG